MNEWAWVATGGAAGSMIRYLIARLIPVPPQGFPVATLIANVVSCVVAGLVWVWLARRTGVPDAVRLLVITGFCGGLSTFSTFSLETSRLMLQGQWGLAAGYVAASLLCCLLVMYGLMRLGTA
ncbi:MAG: fluoride efflux transporter CrcB [Bacteroidia bacterium]|jgi:CrcB protein|nr:fluoride efflux transporter CrcB [Bacteroidia bacterium]